MTEATNAAWTSADTLDYVIQFKRQNGRWPNGITRMGERRSFPDFVTECEQTGKSCAAHPSSASAVGLPPGSHTVADVAAAINADMRNSNIRNYKFSAEEINDLIEPLLRSVNVRGSVGPRIVVAGRFFALTDLLAVCEDSIVPLRTDLAQLVELTPPVTIGRAVASIRAYMGGHT